MTNKNKEPGLKTDYLGKLRDIGRPLAEGAAKHPFVAGLVLIVLIGGTVVAKVGSKEAVILFYSVAVVAMAFIFLMGIKSQKARIRNYATREVSVPGNTITLSSQLTDSQKQDILNTLRGAAQEVANVLMMPGELVRANIFGVDDQNRLRMLKDLTFQMNRQEELTVSMPVGYGSTGRCFQTGKPNIAVFRQDWGKNTIEDEELRKVHPELRWIISIPIFTGRPEPRPTWVLNIDGLGERQEEKQLQKALIPLLTWSQLISIILAKR